MAFRRILLFSSFLLPAAVAETTLGASAWSLCTSCFQSCFQQTTVEPLTERNVEIVPMVGVGHNRTAEQAAPEQAIEVEPASDHENAERVRPRLFVDTAVSDADMEADLPNVVQVGSNSSDADDADDEDEDEFRIAMERAIPQDVIAAYATLGYELHLNLQTDGHIENLQPGQLINTIGLLLNDGLRLLEFAAAVGVRRTLAAQPVLLTITSNRRGSLNPGQPAVTVLLRHDHFAVPVGDSPVVPATFRELRAAIVLMGGVFVRSRDQKGLGLVVSIVGNESDDEDGLP